MPVVAGYYAFNVEPFWPQFHEVPIQIKGLPKSFENFRVLQITDMHTGHAVTEYLQTALTKSLELKPDIVLFTGDLIHHNSDWIETVTTLVKTFTVPVYVSFGNHDYSPFRGEDEPVRSTSGRQNERRPDSHRLHRASQRFQGDRTCRRPPVARRIRRSLVR